MPGTLRYPLLIIGVILLLTALVELLQQLAGDHPFESALPCALLALGGGFGGAGLWFNSRRDPQTCTNHDGISDDNSSGNAEAMPETD